MLHSPAGLRGPTSIRNALINPTLYLKCFKISKQIIAKIYSKIVFPTKSRIHRKESLGNNSEKSIYDCVKAKSNTVTINCKAGSISIINLNYCKLYLLPVSYLSCFLESVKLWRNCRLNGNTDFTSVLNLKYDGILIGDLVCSTALRRYPASGGSLKKNGQLFDTFFSAISICKYITANFANNLVDAYVCAPEPTYLHSIYKRALHALGANVIESAELNGKLKIYTQRDKLDYPYVKPTSCELDQLTAASINVSKKYIENRITGQEQIWYMYYGQNKKECKQILTNEGFLINIDISKNYAVIFLHSFDDGQYYFGVDCFLDLWEWTIFTIDTLVKSSSCDLVIIKQHPNVDKRCPGDLIAFECLLQRYSHKDKVLFVAKDTSLMDIRLIKNVVGITHHGSVAEELTWLGIPVIGSFYAPWRDNYKFLTTWKFKQEYQELLNSMFSRVHQNNDLVEQELLRYLYDYRINVVQIHDSFTWLQYYSFIFGEKLNVSFPNYLMVEQLLSRLTSSDLVANGVLDYLVTFHQDRALNACSDMR